MLSTTPPPGRHYSARRALPVSAPASLALPDGVDDPSPSSQYTRASHISYCILYVYPAPTHTSPRRPKKNHASPQTHTSHTMQVLPYMRKVANARSAGLDAEAILQRKNARRIYDSGFTGWHNFPQGHSARSLFRELSTVAMLSNGKQHCCNRRRQLLTVCLWFLLLQTGRGAPVLPPRQATIIPRSSAASKWRNGATTLSGRGTVTSRRPTRGNVSGTT